MSDELAPGDLAIIVESAMGINIGKIVQLKHLDMPPHSLYGNIWMCSTKEEMSDEWGNLRSNIQIPAKWLKKIEPGSLNKSTKKHLETQE